MITLLTATNSYVGYDTDRESDFLHNPNAPSNLLSQQEVFFIVSMNPDSRKKRILSVEDDADSRELLGFILSDYEVVFAGTFKEAIRLFEREVFHLYLLDNWLSDGAGTDLCLRIRAVNKTVPIVFASGIGSRGDIQKAIDAGAQAYLVKPYLPEKLQQIVKELIEPAI